MIKYPFLATACMLSIGALAVLNAAAYLPTNITGLPTCESNTAEDALKSIVADGILGKLGTKVLLVEDKKTITRTENETKCTATLVLSQFGDNHVAYTITMRNDGRWLLRTVPTDE